MPLDVSTLFIVSTCIAALLGLFLMALWIQDRSIRALGWWALAYLLGGIAVTLWLLRPKLGGAWSDDISSAFLFLSCGMIWSGARMFHGRPPLPLAMTGGAIAWLVLSRIPDLEGWDDARVVISSVIVAAYVILTAIELKRERRSSEASRRHPIVLPLLHGSLFLAPVLTNYLFPRTAYGSNDGFFSLFALLILLYVVGTAFIAVVMSKEHSLRLHRTAALTDPLTGLFNRRGFFEYAQKLADAQQRKALPISLLMFDLDHFKSINDRFGHVVGDETLRVFAGTVGVKMRSEDIVARLGGEEFAAILPSGLDTALAVAQRVRLAFEERAAQIAGHPVAATVSIGAASGLASADDISRLLARADAALYRAKAGGRNCVVADNETSSDIEAPPLAPDANLQTIAKPEAGGTPDDGFKVVAV